MGNIECESGFDVDVIEYANGIGFGLCQWSFGRRDNLEAYAASKEEEIASLETQLEYLLTEINPDGGPADGYAQYNMFDGTYGYDPEDWENASSPEDAAVAFSALFERPAELGAAKRGEAARKYYNMFHK